jgi:hypothetical protein
LRRRVTGRVTGGGAGEADGGDEAGGVGGELAESDGDGSRDAPGDPDAETLLATSPAWPADAGPVEMGDGESVARGGDGGRTNGVPCSVEADPAWSAGARSADAAGSGAWPPGEVPTSIAGALRRGSAGDVVWAAADPPVPETDTELLGAGLGSNKVRL